MFILFKTKRAKKHIQAVKNYISLHYEIPLPPKVQYSLRSSDNNSYSITPVEKPEKKDCYDSVVIAKLLKAKEYSSVLATLERTTDQTFVDKLLYYISKKELNASQVYKAAHVDKRLFSKIISNREYCPSKDTVIALALALELSLSEATDILSRAGYSLSHSNKRDIIIEYFFSEKIFALIEINETLYLLGQKIIGRE